MNINTARQILFCCTFAKITLHNGKETDFYNNEYISLKRDFYEFTDNDKQTFRYYYEDIDSIEVLS